MRKLTFFAAGLALLLLATACSKTTNPVTPNNGSATNPGPASPDSKGNVGVGRTGMRRPDYGQPQRPADISGIIKSVVGNEVTVLKIANQRRASSTPDKVQTGANASSGTRFSLSAGGQSGGGRAMGGFGGPGGGQGTDRAAMLEQLKKMSTGEEKLIIPVGIKMLKSSTNEGKREMVEATLADITADKSLTVWLNAAVTDKKVAEFVLIN